MDKPTNKWFTYRNSEQAKADLLKEVKRSMRMHQTDEEIRARVMESGIAIGGYMRVIDALIAQARNETRIPDPTDQAAIAAAQPIKFMSMEGWDDEPPPRRQWAVRDRIPLRQVTLFSGEGGVNKTTALLQLSVATALARDWLGSMPEPGPVIYMGAEDEADELHRRLHDIAAHYDEPFKEMGNNGLYVSEYAGEDMALARFDRNGKIEPTLRYDRLFEQACDIRPVIIGLDTLSDIFTGNENDRVQVGAFVGLMRKLAMASNSAVIINSHPSQSGSNSGTGLSGSTGWHGKVRGRLFLRYATEQEGGTIDPDLRVLEFKKNQYGPRGDNILLRYRNGVLIPEPRGGSLDPQIAAQRAEQVFVSLLDRYAREGRNVTDKKGTTYAPAKFASEEEAKALNLNSKALEDAMLRLFGSGKIRVVTEGPPSKQRSRLVAV